MSVRKSAILGMTLGMLACGDSQGPDNPVVERPAAVVIGGLPHASLLAGGSVQLTGTVVSASGSVLMGIPLTWQSSDPEVATVSGSGLVTAGGAGPVTITAKADEATGSAVLDVRAGGQLGPDGGTLELLGGTVSLAVLPDALTSTLTILLRPAPTAPASARLVAATAWEVGPEELRLARPGTISIRYSAADIPAGLEEAGLQLYMRDGAAWSLIRGSLVDVPRHVVTGTITRNGTYAVLSTPVDRVVLSGGMVGGALYVGQSAQLQAVVLDEHGDAMPRRRITWSSSERNVVTVDTAGTIAGISEGTATVTAAVDGAAASTSIRVIGAPPTAWNAGDWTTYQGGNRRTGYVDATLDPRIFRQLWQQVIEADVLLNHPVTGGGRVYVSVNSSFGHQRLHSLNALTGTETWVHDFGDIHSAHPPAWANGRVYLTTSGHSDSYLWSFDDATGAVRYRSRYPNQWSRWLAPAIAHGTVYMAGGYYGGMRAFDAIEGTERWEASTAQHDGWTPAIDNGLVFVYTGRESQLAVHDAGAGTRLYVIPDPGFAWSSYAKGGSAVLGSRNNVLVTQGGRLLSFDLATRSVGWQIPGSFAGNVTVADGVLYVVNGGQVDVRRESDGALLWAWAPPVGAPVGPIIVTNNLFFVGVAPSPPAVVGSQTYAVDIISGSQVWSHPVGGHLALGANGILFISSANGRLTAIAVR